MLKNLKIKKLNEIISRLDIIEDCYKRIEMLEQRINWLEEKKGVNCSHNPPHLISWLDEDSNLQWECKKCGRKRTNSSWDYFE
jgi:hypothetical protein